MTANRKPTLKQLFIALLHCNPYVLAAICAAALAVIDLLWASRIKNLYGGTYSEMGPWSGIVVKETTEEVEARARFEASSAMVFSGLAIGFEGLKKWSEFIVKLKQQKQQEQSQVSIDHTRLASPPAVLPSYNGSPLPTSEPGTLILRLEIKPKQASQAPGSNDAYPKPS